MKRYFLLLSLFVFSLVSTAQTPVSNEFVLSGQIKGSKKKFVYLSYTNKNGIKLRDSCLLQNGHFSFKGSISEPTFAIIKTNTEFMPDDENKNISAIFLEPVNMTANIVYDNFEAMVLTGSKTNDEYAALYTEHKFINQKYSDSIGERHSKLSEDYILNHIDSYISAYELSFFRGRWPKNSVQYLYTRLSVKNQNSFYGKEVKSFLEGLNANSEGKKARGFMAKDVQEKIINLSDFNGRYVLLDFWGSWCVPCRESTPHLINLFNKYSEKGFTVIGIGTEYEKTDIKWREAIKKDGTDIWYNVLSNPSAGSSDQFTKEISKMFGVHAYPTKLLIDPCGYIIGRFVGTEEDVKLDEMLKEIFN